MPWDKIAELAFVYGPIGVFALILGYVVYDRDSRLRACETARLEDAEKRADTAREDTKSLERVLQSNAAATAALTVAVESRTAVMTNMSDAIKAGSDVMLGLEKSVAEMDVRIEQLQDALTPRRKS